ncbi:MAG: flavodoxin domain-containing protein [Clostridia bacterium]|nr:flavodoxin domain-containing protein [Clostridia bacterium]
MKSIVLYSSKYGTTEKVAKELALTLQCDLKNLDETKVSLSEYEQIIIGTSVYMGRLRKSVQKFLIQEIQALTNKKITIFFCCNEETDYQALVPTSLKNNAQVYHVGYELLTDEMHFFDKWITKKVAKQTEPVHALNQQTIEQLKNHIQPKL